MIEKWQQLSRDVLKSTRLADPKLQPTQDAKSNREWTVYSDTDELPAKWKGKNRPRGNARNIPENVRARKNTELVRVPGKLKLKFTGDDPGIAMDLRRDTETPDGPYQLTFDLTTKSQGKGDLFFTIDDKTTLPAGTRTQFPVSGSDSPQAVMLEIDTRERLRQLRIDITDGPGTAVISSLQLHDNNGKLVKDWTPIK